MDFLTVIEKALENSDYQVDSIERGDCDADGEHGVLIVTMEDGRAYSVLFERVEG